MTDNNQGFAAGNYLPPEALIGIRRKRIMAVLFDWLFICVLSVLFAIIAAILGFVTFGLAWMLIPSCFLISGILYSAVTLGGPYHATWGMRMMKVELIHLDGSEVTWPVGVLHSLLFYITAIILTPLVLLFSLFSPHKQLVQDYLLSTVVVGYPPQKEDAE